VVERPCPGLELGSDEEEDADSDDEEIHFNDEAGFFSRY